MVYDATEGRILLEVAHPSPGFLRRCNSRLAELVELLRECGERAFLRWECLQLSTRAQGLGDLLERSGLASARAVRCLLHPWLVLGSYLLHSLGILTLAVPALAFLEAARAQAGRESSGILPSPTKLAEMVGLSKAGALKWVALVPGIVSGALVLGATLCFLYQLAQFMLQLYLSFNPYAWLYDLVVKTALRALGVWEYYQTGVELADRIVVEPLKEELMRRFINWMFLGGPSTLWPGAIGTIVIGAGWGMAEAMYRRELRLELGLGALRRLDRVALRIAVNVVGALLPPLPAAALRSLCRAVEEFGPEFYRYWPGVLGPALLALGSLVEPWVGKILLSAMGAGTGWVV